MCSVSGVLNKILDKAKVSKKYRVLFLKRVSFLDFSSEIILLNLMDVLSTAIMSVVFK